MPNKKTARKRAFNRFRLYPIAQKYVQKTTDTGQIQDDYINHSPAFLPCDKTSFRSQEKKIMHTERIITQFKVMIRYCEFLGLQDRLLFLSENKTRYGPDDILRINAMHDRTGRKEYLELYCSRGEYAGQASFQPQQSLLAIKSTSPSKQALSQKITDLLTQKDDFVGLAALGNPDLIIPGIGNKFGLLATGQPFIITPPEITQIQAIIGADQHDFTSEEIMGKAKLWDIAQPIQSNDYLRLSYSRT